MLIDMELGAAACRATMRRQLSDGPELRLLHQENPGSLAVSSFFHVELANDGTPVSDNAAHLFFSEGLQAAAQRLHSTTSAQPYSMFAHLTPPGQRLHPHTDHPVFAGIAPDLPGWIRALMGRSRLFEERRIPVATAVCYFDRRQDGSTYYWEDGVDAPPKCRDVRPGHATVFDADEVVHAVAMVEGDQHLLGGRPQPGVRLRRRDEVWVAHNGRAVLGRWGWQDLRLSVVWKALCPLRPDIAAPDLDRASLIDTFRLELRQRGLPAGGRSTTEDDVVRAAVMEFAPVLPSWPLPDPSTGS